MTIDERLEALTQSVELLAQMHRDNEARDEQRFQKLESLIERIVSLQERLGIIVVDHERRLDNLEQ